MMRWLVLAIMVLSGAGAHGQVFQQSSFDTCFEDLADDASGAACIVPIRTYCFQVTEGRGFTAEATCLDDAILSLEGWTDQVVADHTHLAPLAPQISEYKTRLTAHCAETVGDRGLERERDFVLCKLAGVGALYRDVLRRSASP